MTTNYEWSQRDEKIRSYNFLQIARQVETLKMTTFFKKFASQTHNSCAPSDTTLCKRQNRHLWIPHTRLNDDFWLLTKKIQFSSSKSGDFNGATPSVYLFNILVIITSLYYSNPTYNTTDKSQPPLHALQDGEYLVTVATRFFGQIQFPLDIYCPFKS